MPVVPEAPESTDDPAGSPSPAAPVTAGESATAAGATDASRTLALTGGSDMAPWALGGIAALGAGLASLVITRRRVAPGVRRTR
ncbi:hypothetical protein ASF80_11055 [Microbacterium sp. Leaf159]|nr:hypothetical protein ASF80_11055 [Microbacterium sp. Leaf159]